MSGSFRYLSVLAIACLLVCGTFVFLLFTFFSYQELAAVTQTIRAFSEPGTPYRTSIPTLAEINQIRIGLGSGLAILIFTGIYLQRKSKAISQFGQQTSAGFRQVFTGINQHYRQLTPFEKRTITAFFY